MDVRVSSKASYAISRYKYIRWKSTIQLLILQQMDNYGNMKKMLCWTKTMLLDFICRIKNNRHYNNITLSVILDTDLL